MYIFKLKKSHKKKQKQKNTQKIKQNYHYENKILFRLLLQP